MRMCNTHYINSQVIFEKLTPGAGLVPPTLTLDPSMSSKALFLGMGCPPHHHYAKENVEQPNTE